MIESSERASVGAPAYIAGVAVAAAASLLSVWATLVSHHRTRNRDSSGRTLPQLRC